MTRQTGGDKWLASYARHGTREKSSYWQRSRTTNPTLGHCWASVVDAGPTMAQCRVNALQLQGWVDSPVTQVIYPIVRNSSNYGEMRLRAGTIELTGPMSPRGSQVSGQVAHLSVPALLATLQKPVKMAECRGRSDHSAGEWTDDRPRSN